MFIYLKFVIKGNTDGTSWWIGGFQNPDQDWTWVTGKVTLNMKFESLLEGRRFVNNTLFMIIILKIIFESSMKRFFLSNISDMKTHHFSSSIKVKIKPWRKNLSFNRVKFIFYIQ